MLRHLSSYFETSTSFISAYQMICQEISQAYGTHNMFDFSATRIHNDRVPYYLWGGAAMSSNIIAFS